jgi:ABC-type nickel/cobalt efflux system permease component RcnA
LLRVLLLLLILLLVLLMYMRTWPQVAARSSSNEPNQQQLQQQQQHQQHQHQQHQHSQAPKFKLFSRRFSKFQTLCATVSPPKVRLRYLEDFSRYSRFT